MFYKYKTTLVCRYNPVHHSVFPAGALKALVLQTRASRALAVKPHDVWRIISTHSGGFVYVFTACLRLLFNNQQGFKDREVD